MTKVDVRALAIDGASRVAGVLSASNLEAVLTALSDTSPERAGVRLFGSGRLRAQLAADGVIGRIAAEALGSPGRAVRALLFDKTVNTNWSLGWHQDRAIVVRARCEVEGFGPWTVKQGLVHVAPPYEVLAGMVTLRIHLDPVPPTNAPLMVAPGSHRLGVIAEGDIPATVARCGTFACLADAGDIWVYSTPILHASAAAAWPARRRVLQVDYACGDLPGGLEWLGV